MHELAHKKYEKRARYKTRPDHYDVKPPKRCRRRDTRSERERRRLRHQSHRSGDGHRTTGLVQSFHLKNGPKNHRLTLKPEVSTGLFKHGRASVPTVGRGVGLPDLVFNEMRFLQKPKEHQDADPGELSTRAAKRNRKRSINEEISNYFAEIEPVAPQSLSQRHGVGEIRGRTTRSPSEPSHQRPQSIPPVNLPEKPFLGFGSKGTQGASRSRMPTTNSHLTRSESTRLLPEARVMSQVAEQEETSACPPPERRSETKPVNTHVNTSSVSRKKDQGVDDENMSHDQCMRGRHLRGPARAGLCPPLRDTFSQRQESTSPLRTTSQPLPEHPPPLTCNISAHAASDIPDGSFHTPDILIVREMRLQHERARSGSKSRFRTCGHDQPNNHVGELGREQVEPEKSTPTNMLLRQAEEAVASTTKRRSQVALNSSETRVEAAFHDSRRQNERRIPRQAAICDHCPGPRSRMSMASAQRVSPRHYHQPCPSTRGIDEDEMLDDQPGATPLDFNTGYMYATHRQVEDLVYGRESCYASAHDQTQLGWQQFNEALPDPLIDFEPLSDTIRPQVSVPAEIPIRGLSLDRELRSEQAGRLSVGPESTVADKLAGFWKPHRLY